MVGFPRSGSRERVSEPGEICYNVSKIRNFDTELSNEQTPAKETAQ